MKKNSANSERLFSKHLADALLICIAIIVTCFPVCGLDRDRSINQFHHTAWTAKDGAPSQISAITQTSDGYLWLGSALGLFRFDGVTFEQYEPPDGTKLPSYNIYALLATPDGGLWISFRPSGLGFLKDGQLKIFSRPEEIPKATVYNFARTPDGRIWAGTHAGLVLFNGAGWDEIGADWNFQPDRVTTMFTDRAGTLWIAKGDSVDFLPLGSNAFQTLGKQDKRVKQFGQSKDGQVWAVKDKNTAAPLTGPNSSGAAVKNSFPVVTAWTILFDREGALWIGGGDDVRRIRYPEQLEPGTIRDDDKRIETFDEKDGLSNNSAFDCFEDREGNIWVVTMTGLDRFRYSSIVPVALGTAVKKLTLISGERGDIWMGNAMAVDPYLLVRDGRAEIVLSAPKRLNASSVYRDNEGTIWWGVEGGILRQQNNDFKFFPQPKEMKQEWMWEVIRAGNDGGFWINFGDEGLIYFKDGEWERRKPPEGLPDRGPSASFEDEHKRIWLGYTENRVYILDGERVLGFSSADGIDIGRIKVIRGRGGNFWFGGETGLAFFKNDRFYRIKTEGKPFGAVSGIIATENGDVWLNEVHGIIHISADEIRRVKEDPEHAVKYRLFDLQDNLPDAPQMNFTVSTAVEATDGRLWFATANGLALIDPLRLEKNFVPPPVIIKSVLADDKVYQVTPNTNFPAGTANVQVNYTAASLSIPGRVVFKYRLEGYESGWRDVGTRREAFYTNLAPGKYRFQVIAANNDGVWNEEGAHLEFEILPMFYQTNWFLLICFAMLGGIVWAGYQWRVYQVKSRLHLLYEERLSERARIAHNLHDTFLQGVLGMTMRLQAISNLLPAKPDNAKANLDDVLDQADNVIEESRRGIWEIRTPTAFENDLAQALMLVGEELNKTYSAAFTLTIEGESRSLHPLFRDEIYRIGREALINAFRHSNATEIEAGIEYSLKSLRVFVRDNGCGISPDFLQSGRKGHLGLTSMREFAEKIGAELKIWSRVESGTEVELIVPQHIAFRKESSGGLFNGLSNLIRRRNP